MIRNFVSISAAAAILVTAAMPVAAQGVTEQAVRGKQAGDIVVGLGAIGVLPENGGHVRGIGGRPRASDSASPQLDVTWFATPNIALNLIAASTRHNLDLRGSAIGDLDLGHVWALPPTLTAQFHPFPAARFSPYVGVGLNYTLFFGEGGSRTEPVNKLDVKNSWGWVLNAGIDYELSPRWVLNVDAKKLWLRPDVAVNAGTLSGRADLDPWIVGAGVRYRF